MGCADFLRPCLACPPTSCACLQRDPMTEAEIEDLVLKLNKIEVGHDGQLALVCLTAASGGGTAETSLPNIKFSFK